MKLLLDCMGALPFATLILTLLYCYFRSGQKRLFTAVIQSSLVWSLLIVIESNLLSFLNLLDRAWILGFWLAYLAVILWLLLKIKKNIRVSWQFPTAWLPMYLIMFFTLVGGLAYAPDFHDSLAYHLPRIMHWLQNGSMAPYATSIDRQIGMAPFNAMVIMQTMAIGSNDYFVNVPQWLAFAGCICGAGALAAQLGAKPGARLLAAFYFCSVPIAIMQSGNSESSLIATFWLCVFTSAFLDWWKMPDWRGSFVLGASLGLAILSKGIAYPVALPFVACIGWKCLRQFKSRFLYGVCAAAIILAINVPHFYRNYEATQSLVLSAERNIILKPTPALVTVNALYNFLSQEPWLVKLVSKKGWSEFALRLGVDDHDMNFFPWRGIEMSRSNLAPSDIDGQSPVHALLILFFLPLLVFRHPPGSGLYIYLTCATFLIFFTVITWQPWAARLHLPFFLLCAPLMGIALQNLQRQKLKIAILFGMGLTSFMPTFFCLEHPLGPPALLQGYRENILHFLNSSRDEQYFNFWRHTREPYINAVNYLAEQRPETIGLDLADDGQEYPVWGILGKKLDKMPRIVHTLPPYPDDGSGPDYIFKQHHSSFSELPDPVIYKKEGKGYTQVFPERAIRH